MLLLQIPAFICFMLMIYHAFSRRGKAVAISFFLIYPVLMFVKTWVDANMPTTGIVEYGPGPQQMISIWGVPLIIPIGWVFSFYGSWTIAEILLYSRLKTPPRFYQLLSMVALINGLVSLSIETAGITVGWWKWHVLPSMLHPPLAWTVVSYYSLFPYFYCFRSDRRPQTKVLVVICWLIFSGLVIAFQLGQYGFFLCMVMVVFGWLIKRDKVGWPQPPYLQNT